MTTTFELHNEIRAPIEVVFDLAVSIDLHVDSFAHTDERAVAGVTSGVIGLGEEVTWRGRHFGITWTMTSRVTELERPTRFTDEQVRGPFAHFRHEHVLSLSGDGTVMADRVSFAAPFGPIGWLVERLVLARYLRKLIVLRNDHLRRAAEAHA